MSSTVIQVDSLWKKYRLGVLGTGTLRHDFNRWLHRLAGRPDPYAVVGQQDHKTTGQQVCSPEVIGPVVRWVNTHCIVNGSFFY